MFALRYQQERKRTMGPQNSGKSKSNSNFFRWLTLHIKMNNQLQNTGLITLTWLLLQIHGERRLIGNGKYYQGIKNQPIHIYCLNFIL